MYLLERQIHHRSKPLNQAEILRLYGQTKGQSHNLGQRLGALLGAGAKAITARFPKAPAYPILETK